MNKIFLTLSFVFCLLHLFAFSQSDSAHLTTIASKLQKLSATHPVEKVYLQFNQPDYTIGDTIWFKSYVTVGAHHQPSALSGILYVELIDSKDKIIKSLQLKIAYSTTTGDFAINNSMPPGDYHIRAYTTWMRNAGPDYFFNKTISIGNVKTNAVFISSLFNRNDEGSVSSVLTYTDKFGRPFDNKAVTYEIKADTTTLYKATGITNDKGSLKFSFSDKAAAGQKRVNIISHIRLINGVIIDKTVPLNLQTESVDVQFFPEGGQLVNDVRSKLAFKAVGTNGLGADVKGVVTDNDNNEVAYFTSQHAGMGIFALTPQAGKTYTAKVTLANGAVSTVKLPQAAEKGFVLAVNSSDSTKLSVRIATNAATLQAQPNATFYLVGQSGEVIYYTTAGKLNNQSFTASVPKNKFPTGIAQFTLFSSANEPLNERVVFIQNNNDLLNLNLTADKPVYKAKEKVNMTFSAKDAANKPVLGTFSLSVFNEAQTATNENAESTILSDILLTSDLKGYIEEPGYYFNQVTDQTKADLDVLMLTQGYRRFEWKDIMTDHYPQMSFQPEKLFAVSGTLTNSSGKPIAKGKVSILSVADGLIVDTVSDADGKFLFKNVKFSDSARLVIQARKANDGKNVNITLDNGRTVPLIFKSNIADASQSLSPPLVNLAGAANATGKADTMQIAAAITANAINSGRDLKEVTIKDRQPDNPDKSNLWGSTRPLMTISGAKLEDYFNIASGLVANGEGVRANNGKIYDTDPIVAINAKAKHTSAADRPIPIVLNGVAVMPGSDIDVIAPANTIDNLKIVEGPALKALYGIDPNNPNTKIIIITTKQFAGTNTAGDTVKNSLKKVKLDEVTIKSRKNEGTELNPWQATVTNSSNLNGAGHADMVVPASALENCLQLSDCLQAKIPGIIIKGDNLFFARHVSQSITSPPPILFMIDGINLGNSLDLLDNNVIVSTIQTIEVLNSSSYLNVYGTAASGGLLIITTKIGSATDDNAISLKSAPGVIYTKFNGFYRSREFYVPKYTPTNVSTADSRTAIYWNPDMATDGSGTLPVEFFNSDVKGTYRAVVEGIDNDGNIGRYVYRYKVE